MSLLITQYGDSALMRAAYLGQTEAIVELVKAGADLNLQNKACLNVIIISVSSDQSTGSDFSQMYICMAVDV